MKLSDPKRPQKLQIAGPERGRSAPPFRELCRLGGFVGLFFAGCSPDLGGQHYSTPHLEIHTAFDEPLCKGDLLRMEDFIVRTKDMLGMSMDRRVDVYLCDDLSGVDLLFCSPGATGCYLRGRNAIYTTFGSLNHELVHAITAETGYPGGFFNEGIASALDDNPIRFKATRPIASHGKTSREVDRGAAAHFTRWLLDTFGAEKWMQIQTSRGKRSDFRRIYGLTLEEAEEEYLLTSPWVYPAFFHWDAPDLAVTPLGWREEIEFDCDRDDALGGPDVIGIVRILWIEEAGYYDFWTTADQLSVYRQMDEPVVSRAQAEAEGAGDFPVVDPIRPFGRVVVVSGEEIRTLYLAADRYEVVALDFDRDSEGAVIAVVPHMGPLRKVPEAP